jgi:hypothetical protein
MSAFGSGNEPLKDVHVAMRAGVSSGLAFSETGVAEQVERDMISSCHADAAEVEQALQTPKCCTPGEKEW